MQRQTPLVADRIICKRLKVLSVLRKVSEGGLYRQKFGILPQICLCLTSCQAIAEILKQNTKTFQTFFENRRSAPNGVCLCCLISICTIFFLQFRFNNICLPEFAASFWQYILSPFLCFSYIYYCDIQSLDLPQQLNFVG